MIRNVLIRVVLVVGLLAPAGRARAQEPPAVTIDLLPPCDAPDAAPLLPPPAGRFDAYVRSTLGSPSVYFRAMGESLADRLDDRYDWDGNGRYARSAAAHFGRALASVSIRHGVAAALGADADYRRVASGSGWSRFARAVSGVVVTRGDAGETAPNVGLWAGEFGGAALANAWFPRNYTARDAVRTAAVGIAATAAVNVVREFAPELKRLFVGTGNAQRVP